MEPRHYRIGRFRIGVAHNPKGWYWKEVLISRRVFFCLHRVDYLLASGVNHGYTLLIGNYGITVCREGVR